MEKFPEIFVKLYKENISKEYGSRMIKRALEEYLHMTGAACEYDFDLDKEYAKLVQQCATHPKVARKVFKGYTQSGESYSVILSEKTTEKPMVSLVIEADFYAEDLQDLAYRMWNIADAIEMV